MLRTTVAALALLIAAPCVLADASIPNADLKGARDTSLVGRYQGSFIVSYDRREFDELTLPLSPLVAAEDKDQRDAHNNRVFAPQEKKTVEGTYTRLVYLMPDQVSPLEVVRNYQEEIEGKGGAILYQCKEDDCGGDPSRGSEGGGGEMSLAMYLRPNERIKDPDFSNGNCAQATYIMGQRYLVGTVNGETHLSVLAYSVKGSHYCKALDGRTVAVVDIVEPKQRQQKMVTVKAEEMARDISNKGRVALYGIYFDFDKAEVKPESKPTLEQIAQLLKQDSGLKLLVVGHTDNVGAFRSNQDLSQRRAAAVVTALTTEFKVDKSRLTAVGVSFACPVAPNDSDEGRAKNRRVELVKH